MTNLTLRAFGVIAFLTVFLALLLPTPAHAAPQRVCRPARVEHVIYWPGEGPFVEGTPYRGEAVWRVLQGLRGPSFWRKVGDYGTFDIPAGWAIISKLYLLPGRQWYWFAAHPSQPDTIYVFVFPNDAYYALPDGTRLSMHPTCGTFKIEAWSYARILLALSDWRH